MTPVPRYGCILILLLLIIITIPDTECFLFSSLSQTALLVFTSTILRDATTLMPHSPPLRRTTDTSAAFKTFSLSLSPPLLSSEARVFSLYQLNKLIELQSDSRKHTHRARA